MSERCMVFFKPGACDLKGAQESLLKYRLVVEPDGDDLVAGRPGSPHFRIRLATDANVASEAAEIGDGTRYANEMRKCTARFEIEIDDLDAALDEMNTLMEVQGAIQDA